MITSVFGLLSQSVIVDQASNGASAIEILESCNVLSLPMVFPMMTGFFGLHREDGDPEDITVDLTFTSNGELKHRFDNINVNFQGRNRTRVILRFGGYQITDQGLFEAVLSYDGRELSRVPVEIVLVDELTAPTMRQG